MTTKAMPSRVRKGSAVWPIRTEADYDRAVVELDKLVLRDDLAADEQDRLDILTALIENYDSTHYSTAASSRTPAERLKSLMKSSGVTPAELGDVIGSRPAASMVLRGQRELSKSQIRKLADHFKLSVAYFF